MFYIEYGVLFLFIYFCKFVLCKKKGGGGSASTAKITPLCVVHMEKGKETVKQFSKSKENELELENMKKFALFNKLLQQANNIFDGH